MEKTVLIACPTCGLDQDPNRWLTSLLSLQNQIRANGMGQAFIAPYRLPWWQANNQIWDTAFTYAFDYILRIDDDVWGVPDDAFARLLVSNKDVIGAAYPSRHYPHVWCALNRAPEAKNKSLFDISAEGDCLLKEVAGEGIQPVDLVGFGLTLIKVSTFEGWERPIFSGAQIVPDDTAFAQKCLEKGVQQHVHMDVQLCHRDIQPILKAKNKKG